MNARAVDADTIGSGSAVEWWTMGWMLVEAEVSLGAGVAAGSVALVAFGADSVIEGIRDDSAEPAPRAEPEQGSRGAQGPGA